MTAQIPDQILLQGELRPLLTLLPVPFDHPRIVPLSRQEAARRFPETLSTACHRRYLATWAIRDDRLYLTVLRGLWELRGEEPLFAAWFTGTLGVGMGNVVRRAHFGFETVYESALWIAVREGVVTAYREEAGR